MLRGKDVVIISERHSMFYMEICNQNIILGLWNFLLYFSTVVHNQQLTLLLAVALVLLITHLCDQLGFCMKMAPHQLPLAPTQPSMSSAIWLSQRPSVSVIKPDSLFITAVCCAQNCHKIQLPTKKGGSAYWQAMSLLTILAHPAGAMALNFFFLEEAAPYHMIHHHSAPFLCFVCRGEFWFLYVPSNQWMI